MTLTPKSVIAALIIAVAVPLLVLQVWRNHESDFWQIPAGFAEPIIPADNPMNRDKVRLGRLLFYDRRLSINGTTSCASCHQQEKAFTDGKVRSTGATGQVLPRNAMSLVNVAYASRFNWANHRLDNLEEQALTPLFSEDPMQLGLAGQEKELVTLLSQDADYQLLFAQAFPNVQDPYSVLSAVRAIAAFVRTIVSFDSRYDRYQLGDQDALSFAEFRGMKLFNSERLECFHCHGGINFTDSSTHASGLIESVGFHNIGLYNIGFTGAYPPDNAGLFDLTGEQRDIGRFKAPTLRNIAITAPYMHDGSVATLDEAIDHYQRGGRNIADGPFSGDGSRNPFKSEFLRGFELSDEERAELLAFLAALSDESVLDADRFSDPRSESGEPADGVAGPSDRSND